MVTNCSLVPLDVKKCHPKKLTCLGYVKMHGFMVTHSGFKDGGMPTKILILS